MRTPVTTLALVATLWGMVSTTAHAAVPTAPAEPVSRPEQVRQATVMPDARAKAPDSDTPSHNVMDATKPHHLGVGFTVLTALGYGPLIRGRYGPVGLEIAPTLGVEYLFNRGKTACTPVVFEFPWRITVSALGWFSENELLSHAFRIGVTANQLYGWGGMIGYHLELAIFDRLTLDLDTGVIVHPIGHQRVFEHLKDRCGSHVRPSVSSELTNTIWLYTGVGMTLYLF